MNHKNQGFTLIELMIVVAIIAIIAAIAVPNLLSARLAANESNAIATLRNLSSAQSQVHQMGAIDADADGTGEYGYFGDLSGLYDLDQHAGATNTSKLAPPVLGASFRNIDANGMVTKGGYIFQLWLPDAAGDGVAEDGTVGSVYAVDADNCEVAWACYAWPGDYGNTGRRAFFVNQQGEIIATSQAANPGVYDGTANAPTAGAAFVGTATEPATATSIMVPLEPGAAAFGGETWVSLQ